MGFFQKLISNNRSQWEELRDWFQAMSQPRLTEDSQNPLPSISLRLETSFAPSCSLWRHLLTCETHHRVGEVKGDNARETAFSKELAEETVSAIHHVTWGRKKREKKIKHNNTKKQRGRTKTWKFDIRKSTWAIRENSDRHVGIRTVNQIIQEAEAEGYQVPGQSRLCVEKEGRKGKGAGGEGRGRGKRKGQGRRAEKRQYTMEYLTKKML